MNYSTTYVTRPIRYDEVFELPIQGSGDSYFISLIEHDIQLENLGNPRPPLRHTLPSVRISEVGEGIAASVIEGEDVNVTVELTRALTTDLNVTVDVVFDDPAINIRRFLTDNAFPPVPDTSVHTAGMQTGAVAADFVALQVVITIPAGDSSASGTLTTVDDATLTQSLRTATLSISAIDSVEAVIEERLNDTVVIIQDATPYPAWEAPVEVFVKAHELSHKEPLISSETSTTQTFTVGWKLADDGSVGDESTLRSIQVDDIPVHGLFFEAPVDGVPTDLTVGAVDLTGMLPYYRAIVQVGRRQ